MSARADAQADDQSETRPQVVAVVPEVVDCLGGGGEMGAIMRSIDWAKTRLGPVESWPRSLKTIVGVVLRNRFPMLLWWGPEMLQIYNDAYRPVLGVKHPASMGAPAPQVWAEIWNVVGPMAESVLAGGPATWNEHLLLFLNSRGFVEETYHTFSYSPVPGDTGEVAGVLVTVQETTQQVQDHRQLRLLRDLAARSYDAKSVEDTCRTAATILAGDDADIPLSCIYLVDDDARRARLAVSSGFGAAASALPASVDLETEQTFGFRRLLDGGGELVLDDLGARLGPLPGGAWNVAPDRAVVIPLGRAGQRVYGFFVAALSPRRAWDERYLSLFRLTADQIVTALGNARAYEEERRRAEALAEIDRAKTAFFSNVSHEFRTPLTLMLGPLDDALSAEVPLDGPSLAAVHRNALRLLKLVNTLLDFSRIEAGRMQASFAPTDLATLTADLASAFRSAVERAGLRFEVECAPLSRPAFVDRDLWEKIVLNLLSNALKFTFEGAIAVRVVEEADGFALTVADSGTGIPPAELPHLFERFHRVQGARARTHEGSGIGLALVHELARMHGGSVAVDSAVGRGTTFTVRIPSGSAHLPGDRIASGAPAATAGGAAVFVSEALRWLPAASGDAEVAAEPALGSLAPPASDVTADARILVADDNADMRDYLRRLLAPRWTVTTVSDGREALAEARAQAFDVIVSDVMMPNLDGFGLLRELRADQKTRDTPFIMLSARAGEEARVEGLRAGVDDYLVKPFSARELIARVESQIARVKIRQVEESHAARLRSIFEHAPVGIAVMRGPEHVYEVVNFDYAELVSRRDLVGKSIRDGLPELAGQGIYELLDTVYATGEPYVGRGLRVVLNRGPEGVPVECFFDFVYQPLRNDDGAVEGVIVVCFDVTELARARHNAEAANRAKDEFLAILGHELRNPLAPILTALQLMRLRGGDTAERERTIIDRQVQHLVRLVDDLLDVSRVTRGKIELKRQATELAEVVAKAIEMTSPLLEEREHLLRVDVPRQGLRVNGDPMRLAQVFSNILANAAKYTEAHGRVTIEAGTDGDEAVVSIRDSGVGIAAETLPHVFDLFVQEHQPIDRSRGGLGLGLSIVRSLVQLHGGTVAAHSDGRGRGSTFTVRLPLIARGDSAALAVSPPPPSIAPARQTTTSVLIIDDNRDAAELLGETLRLLGFAAHLAHDGPSGLAAATRLQPRLVLLDIGLPVMDGYEVARRIRATEALQPTRLVAVTGYGQESDRARARDAGFDDHLVKPIDIERLLAVITQLTGVAAGG